MAEDLQCDGPRSHFFPWLYLSHRLQISPTPGLLALLWAGLLNKDLKLPTASSDSSYIMIQCCKLMELSQTEQQWKVFIFFSFLRQDFWGYHLLLCSQIPLQSPLTIHFADLTAGCFSFENFSVTTVILFLACEQHSYNILPGGQPSEHVIVKGETQDPQSNYQIWTYEIVLMRKCYSGEQFADFRTVQFMYDICVARQSSV